MKEHEDSASEISFDVDYKDLLLSLLHEAHVISNVINTYAEIISRAINGEKIDKDAINDHAYKIIENAYLLSLLLNRTEFEIDPSSFEKQVIEPEVSLYGKFKKAVISLKMVARSKKMRLLLRGSSSALLSFYPIIDLLPYLLLENALKYSPKELDILIQFFETSDCVKISVSSVGPALKPGELDRVFEKGFRGYEASKMVKQGSGRGLALAKYICDIHHAEIKIEVGNEDFVFEGIPHSSFSVVMCFQRH